MKKFILSLLLLLLSFSFLHAQLVFGDSVPVRLSYMDGERIGSNNRLDWSVACFLEYANFDIQRSQDGINYKTIYTFQADELRCRQPFNYTDIHPAEKSFYRIRVGDLDGRYYSSKTVALYGQVKGFDITSITPTITTGEAMLNLSSSSSGKVEITITSATGLIAKKISYVIKKGTNIIPLQLNKLQNGMYFISALNSEVQRKTSVVIKN